MGMRGKIPPNQMRLWCITMVTMLVSFGIVALVISSDLPETATYWITGIVIVAGCGLPIFIDMVREVKKTKDGSGRRQDVDRAMMREEEMAAATRKVADEARNREEWNRRLTAKPLKVTDEAVNELRERWICPVCKEINEPETKQCKFCEVPHPSLV